MMQPPRVIKPAAESSERDQSEDRAEGDFMLQLLGHHRVGSAALRSCGPPREGSEPVKVPIFGGRCRKLRAIAGTPVDERPEATFRVILAVILATTGARACRSFTPPVRPAHGLPGGGPARSG